MRHGSVAVAIVLAFGLSMPRAVAAKGGHGGGHSGGGHSGGGHASGGHASAGQSGGGRAASGKASGGQTSGGRAAASTRGVASAPPVATTQPRGSSRTPNGSVVVGAAVPRSSSPHDVGVVAPSIYTPYFFRPHFTGLGFNFGIPHLGYGYGPAYYSLGFGSPLWCETTFDCDVASMSGTVDVAPSYETAPPTFETAAPFERPAAPSYQQPPVDTGSGTVRLDVEPVTAQIFVDGEYVGTVEDFRSGAGLVIGAGIHRVEFRAIGYAPSVVDMRIAAGRRITYRATLKPEAE
jgi:hypothetical protein